MLPYSFMSLGCFTGSGTIYLMNLALFLLLAASYQRIYVFGDSYSDTGAGYVDGNGPTAVAYLAERMHTPLLASTDPKATPTSSLNFAVSGATTGQGKGNKTGDVLLGLGMENQVDDFVARVKARRVRFSPGQTLFYIAGGLNDRRLESAETVRNLEGRIRVLYKAGARHFALAVLPTELPAFREVGVRLNPAIVGIPDELKRELPGIDIRLSRWGHYFDEVMRNPASFGIENTKDACAGREIFKEDATPCKSPGAYYYYHAGHPSTAVHKVVGDRLYQELTSAAVSK